MKVNRLLSLILCICVTACSVFVPITEAEEITTYEVSQRVSGLLNAVGVTKPEDNVDKNTLISRGQFAIYAARLIGDNNGESHMYYNDVPVGSFCYDAASVLVKIGALSVGEDKLFNPHNVITYHEACKILVCVLGFKDYAEAHGGYSKGYEYIAMQNDIDYGLVGRDMNYKNVMQMLYNACHVPLLDIQGTVGSYITWEQGSETILSRSRDICYIEGRVDKADDVSIIDETRIGKDLVEINGISFYEGKSGIEEALGYNVEAYYRRTSDDEPGTMIYYYDGSEKQIIDIENFEGYNRGVLTYTDGKNSKKRTIDIDTTAPILLNGRPVKTNITAAFNNTTNGRIEVVFQEDEVSLVHIRRKETIVIRSTNENQQSVWDEYRTGKYFIFDEKEYDRINVYKVNGGEKISFYHMQKGQVLNIYKSLDGKVADVYMSDTSIIGTANQIIDDEVAIDGVFYKINKEMKPYLKLGLGVNACFYLDADGEISAMEPVVDENRFAYIYSVYKSDVGEDTQVKMKVFTAAGNHEILDVKVPVTVDGNRVKTVDGLLAALASSGDMGTYRQLVGIRTNNSGEVSKIDTAAASKVEAEEAGSLVTQLKYTGTATTHRIPSNNPSFELGPIYYRGTKVIVVPEESYSSTDKDLFRSTDKNYFNQVKGYKISSYKTDYTHPYADFIVVREEFTPDRPYGTDMPIMVDEIYTRLDKNGEPVKVIKGVRQGVLYEAECRDNPVFKTIQSNGQPTANIDPGVSIASVDDLRRGDLIRATVGIDGKVALIQVLHDFEENQKPYWYGKNTLYEGTRPGELGNVYQTFSLTAGYVIDVYYDKFRELDWVERPPVVVDLGYSNTTTVDRQFLLASDAITIYDIENDKVFSGTSWEDITTYSSGYGGSYMIAASVNYNSRGMYLYVYPGGE